MAVKASWRLYFFFRIGCDWCEKARPEAEAFIASVPLEGLLIPKNLDRNPDGVLGYVPNATPAYLLVGNAGPLGGTTGMMTRAELAKWVAEVLDADAARDEGGTAEDAGEDEDAKDDSDE